MTKIFLHGELGNIHGKEFDLAVGSVPEAIRALCYTKKGFYEDVQKWDYQIFIGDPDSKDSEELDEDTLNLKTNRDVHIYPVVDGAGKGVGKIIAAIILITAAFVIGGPQSGLIASTLFNVGVSVGLAGLSALLTPTQQTAVSKLFNNDPLTSQQGTPIPVLYGEMYFPCFPISASVTTGLQGLSVALDVNGGINSGAFTGTDAISIGGILDGWDIFSGNAQIF